MIAMRQARRSKKPDKNGCPKSGKVRYADKANARAGAIAAQEARPSPPLHVYECPFCKGWHLTSQQR